MDKIRKAKALHNELEMYSTKYIKKVCGPKTCKVYFCDRWYGTFDKPDWTYHFEVSKEEAEEIVQKGYARYWFSPEETFS